MQGLSTPEAERVSTRLPTVFNWKGAHKISACAFILAFAPVAVSFAGTTGGGSDTDTSSGTTSDSGYVAPAPAAPAAPAAAAPAAAASSASAESTSGMTDLEQVTVTGSALPLADAKTALPVTVYNADQLKQQGITSVSGILNQVASNQTDDGPGLKLGYSITGGANFADLRGLGPNSTLILVNGRRLANNAFDGGAADLNGIPFAAIEKVEVLRSGASALYGTDAIGGVINFITKKNFQGGDFNITYKAPTRSGGGNTRQIEATFGVGNLNKDRYNLMGAVSYNQEDALLAGSRQNIVYPYRPNLGLNSTLTYTIPANYYQDEANGNVVSSNPAAARGCPSRLQIHPAGSKTCLGNSTPFFFLQSPDDNASFFGQGTYKLTQNNIVSATYLYDHDESLSQFGPYGVFGYIQPGTKYYPGGSGGVPANPNLNTSKPISVRYLNGITGPRRTRNLDTAQRFVLDFKGHRGKTHYDTAFSFNQQKTALFYVSGYLNYAKLNDAKYGPTTGDDPGEDYFDQALNSGLVDPFTPSLSPAGQAYFNNLVVSGLAEQDRGETYHWDGKVNRELGNWFGGGQVALALGSDVRYVTLKTASNNAVESLISGGGLSGNSISEHRTVEGVYGEIDIPLRSNLDIDAAGRFNNYSDFGSTADPKVSLRYQPFKQLVLRGSYSEGYQAPTLYDLYTPEALTYTQTGLNDPVLCPNGTAIKGYETNEVCNTQFARHYGGYKNLKPATSEQYNLGIILQPTKDIYAEVDYWHVVLTDEANLLPVSLVFNNLDKYGSNIVRYGPNSPNAGQINYINTPYANLGTTDTSGIDTKLNLHYSNAHYGKFELGMEGTYVFDYKYQNAPGSKFMQNAGRFVDYSPVIQWQSNITLSWDKGPIGASVINHYTSGYVDAVPSAHHSVNPFITWDAALDYHFHDGVTLTAGSRNIFDRDPPFSNQNVLGTTGYDPRYASAIGRTVYGRLDYRF